MAAVARCDDRRPRRPRRALLDRPAARRRRGGRAGLGRHAARGQPLRRDQRRLRPPDRRRRAPGGGAADGAAGRRRRQEAAGRAPRRRRVRRPARARRPASAKAAFSPASWSRRSAGRSCRATMSSRLPAGSAWSPSEPGDDASALLRRASVALAEAKAAETGAVRVLEAGAAGESALGDRLEVDLRRALDQDEIEILFQPQVVGRERPDRRRRGARPLAPSRISASLARSPCSTSPSAPTISSSSPTMCSARRSPPPPPGRRRWPGCGWRSTSPPPTSSGPASPRSSSHWSRKAASIRAGSPSR